MENLCAPKPIKMITVIIDRGRGKKAIKILNEYALGCQYATYGTGTASTEVRTYFGLEDTQRDIIFAIVPNEKTREILEKIKEKFHLHKPNTGIAFTIPIKCVASMLAFRYMIEQ